MFDEELKKDLRALCEGLRHCANKDMCDDCTYREKCDERHACDRAAGLLELMCDIPGNERHYTKSLLELRLEELIELREQYENACIEREAVASMLAQIKIEQQSCDVRVALPADSKQALVVVLAEDDESEIGGIGYSTGFHIADGNWVLERKGKVLYWMPIPKIPMEMIRSAMVKGREEYGK